MSLLSENHIAEISELGKAHLRVARPTDQMSEIVEFYVGGLGFEIIGSFQDHEGFDGVMVGHPASLYHLEFTHHDGSPVGRAPTQDHLLVFYLDDADEWQKAVERMQKHGYGPVSSYNPYWDTRGKTFEDPDGYRVV